MTAAGDFAPHLASLATALERLAAALRQPKTEWTRDAAIQRFELTFELAWKAAAPTPIDFVAHLSAGRVSAACNLERASP